MSSADLLSDRTLAFSTTSCFRIDISDPPDGNRSHFYPGEAIQGTLRISNKFLRSGGGGHAKTVYHSIDVSVKAEARLRSSVHMPHGNVVPSFETICLWRVGQVQVWPRPTPTPEADELGLVSIPFTVRLPSTVPALSNSPSPSANKSSSSQAAQVIQIAPLPSCTLPPGLQIVVSVVAEAQRTSTVVKRPRRDIVQLPILLHRQPSDRLLRWLPPAEDPKSHLLRFDPRFWTSSTTIVTLKQTLLDRRRLWITLTIPNVSRTNGAAESERIPFLLEILYQSKRQASRTSSNNSSSTSSHMPPANMVDQTALPTLPLSTSKRELEPRLFIGQRVLCNLEEGGTTSDFRQDDLEIEWDSSHLEPSVHVPSTSSSTSNTTNQSGFTPRDRVLLRPGAKLSGLELFQGHGWTLPERKSINEIKAYRQSLERGSESASVDDVVGLEEGDEEDENDPSERSGKDRSLSHHTSSTLSTLRKALLPSSDPDSVGYWISRAAVSGTFRAPAALPSFDFAFGSLLRKEAKASGFDSPSTCSKGQLSLSYEVGVTWTVPESAQPGPEDPRSAHGKKRTILTFKTFERGLVPWFSSSTGSYPLGDEEEEEGMKGRSDLNARDGAFPLTRADVLRNAKAKCKAAKLGRREPDLSQAESQALEEEAENGRAEGGVWSGRSTAGAKGVADDEGDEDDYDDDDEVGMGMERRRRLRERNALLFNLPPGYFAATSDFEDLPGKSSSSSSAASAPPAQHNHPVIALSDVLLQVLGARDPPGPQSISTERLILSQNKRIIFILNKVDLVPQENVLTWLKYLRNDFPTLAFKSSTQSQRTNLGQKYSASGGAFLAPHQQTNRWHLPPKTLGTSAVILSQERR
ncbi:hypothetical protein A4X13_0g3746 [Tilletia indica]|uniref:Uncharacterized protein n=1 Tax=Tilletia indica TaxID=43049 RepID=A0A8T8T1S4_9BASI|nr:hypothetical protein A4X13_0g3746 [Tilletia indica]